MGFRPQCPKCGHKPLSLERDTRARVDIASCYICAWTLYGRDEIEKLVREQMGSYKAPPPAPTHVWSDSLLEAHARRRAKRSESSGPEEPSRPPDWPKCSWKDCDNPTKGTKTGKPLKYCCRRCSLKNAHLRDKQRKLNGRKGQ